ncbi:helix-turn-helix transcriptional regulator [Streptomyces sp. HC44]|uniref:Helix-turn-helix transcriptional regulator n=1 Tax=Streptomyces scabichelini TaxID=2711217 RepID=A0A6G4V6Z6_9ACTN|nr:helix-turn-helix domain-containing protein [Streptomyces scabichelini]NGO09627.1 helix-turn-helix transcriptional regulator [Streptomyces scabichelini]
MAQEPGATHPAEQGPAQTSPSAEPPAPIELSDLAALKALAQPRRQRMLQHLTVHGPATSATLARALGLNTGATSYHLRELARYGFVEETEAADGSAGHGRERWWRAVPGDRRFPPRSRQSPEMRLVMDELNHHAYAADLELFEQLQRDAADDPWADAFPYSRGTIRLTLPELREFFEEYIALLNRYKRPEADTPPGARTVLTRFLAYPAQADAPGATQADAPGATQADKPDDSRIDAPGDSTPDNRKETETS